MPMADPAILQDETRLTRLREFSLLLERRPAETAYDRLTRMAAKLLHAPVALVTMVEGDQQRFISQIGLKEPWATTRRTPLTHSFCQHVVAGVRPLVIEDARQHPLVCDNLAVTELEVEAYLGMPLTTEDGLTIGSLCVIDHQPRSWTNAEIDLLSELARLTLTEIELQLEIERRDQAERELSEQRRLVDGVMQLLPDIVAVASRDRQSITYTHLDLAEFLGYPRGALESARIRQQIIHPDDRALAEEVIAHSFSLPDGAVTDVELRVQAADGSYRWILRRATPFERDEDGRVSSVISFLQDITARKMLELARAEQHAELQALYDRVRDLEQAKSEVIQLTSHDLRNPLGLILGYTDLLLTTEPLLDETQVEYLVAIQRSAQKMLTLIRDLLSLERLDSGAAETRERLSLTELVAVSIDEHADQIAGVGLTLETQLPSEPLHLTGLKPQLREAIDNLLTNAIKYTPKGGTIRVTLSAADGWAEVRITDTGYGIAPEQQTQLFQPFYRVKAEHTEQIAGTGLGLHLVKRIIERHGGAMIFNSAAGVGSTFGFRLPLGEK